jgi:hypothetical protein
VNRILSHFVSANSPRNSYVSEKIKDVRRWFDELGKGGRGKWEFAHAQEIVQPSIGKLEGLITDDGNGFRTRVVPEA